MYTWNRMTSGITLLDYSSTKERKSIRGYSISTRMLSYRWLNSSASSSLCSMKIRTCVRTSSLSMFCSLCKAFVHHRYLENLKPLKLQLKKFMYDAISCHHAKFMDFYLHSMQSWYCFHLVWNHSRRAKESRCMTHPKNAGKTGSHDLVAHVKSEVEVFRRAYDGIYQLHASRLPTKHLQSNNFEYI